MASSSSSGVVLEACKGSKKRNQEKLYSFETFAKNGTLKGPFRETIRLFLQEFAVIQSYKVSGMPFWSVSLISDLNAVVFPLYTVEETVHQQSTNPICDHCKFTGWGHHYVSRRRYHMIIPANDNWNKPLKANFSKLKSHLLHGLIHCNGYGHLVCINGDSISITADDLMDFWDRLCTMLKIRKMSVCDVSKEGEMELRLLNGVAYGRCWFGKWGYKFSRGSYGVTDKAYKTATQFLSSLGLDKIVNDLNNNRRGRKIKEIIEKYRGVSIVPLITMSDLLQFMLGSVKLGSPRKKVVRSTCDRISRRGCEYGGELEEKALSLEAFVARLVKNGSRWPARRLEHVLRLIVDLLKENKAYGDGMSRQELREEARKCIGDTGLIDFVLKSIRCFAVGNLIVRRTTNVVTNLLEFSIHEALTEEAEEGSVNFPISDCRWSEERLKNAAQVVFGILQGNGDGDSTMSWQELHDKASVCIADTELIDFVMKSTKNYVVGHQVVNRSIHPAAKRVKFSIQDGIDLDRIDNFDKSPDSFNVYEDLLFLYKNVLLEFSESDTVSFATRVVLNSKQFVKEWLFEEQVKDQQLMPLTCQVLPSFDELETELTRPLSPGEIVIVPDSITIRQLKMMAQCALRDTYCIMENFIVKQIGGLRAIEDEKVLCFTLEPGAHVWVRGSGLDLDTKLRYEGVAYAGRVDCVCGTRDDDGERLVVCDICHVWQHTLCVGIDDDEVVPSMFVCTYCSNRVGHGC